MKQKRPMRVCLVTEELSYGKGTGGIGGAFHELALALRRAGHAVDVIYVPEGDAAPLPPAAINYYDAHGIRLIDPDISQYVWSPFSYEKRSYAIFRHLVSLEENYDFIHFHDYRGLGAVENHGIPMTTACVIQAPKGVCHGSVQLDGCAMGENGTFLPW